VTSPVPSLLLSREEAAAAGEAMHALARRLMPFRRSLTGDGVRETLAVLAEDLPLAIREVSTGTPVFDWTVPREWNLREAWIRDEAGNVVVDAAAHPLHVLGYSVPVDVTLDRDELLPHLHSLPDRPDWIPYRTSYWRQTWGFCLPHRRVEALPPGRYHVHIDATLADGQLTWGELHVPSTQSSPSTKSLPSTESLPGAKSLPGTLDQAGAGDGDWLVSCHVCHPGMANDNLSGIVVAAALARRLMALPERRHGWRFLFVPGTIGAITWLALNEALLPQLRGGIVAANLGDAGGFTWKRSRAGDSEVDRAVAVALRDSGEPHAIEPYSPYGYDERQYNSPGIRLPVGCLSRTPWGRYPQYHTSADDLAFVTPGQLAGSLAVYGRVAAGLEGNARYLNLQPKGEPQLGRRGLYGSLGGAERGRESELAMLWVLSESDGDADLLAIAERSGLPFDSIRAAADALLAAELLREA
jgi:aminopeptidase-like protein